MIRLGLIGCGAVASYGHMPAIRDTPGLELVSVLDPDPLRLSETRERFGVQGTFSDPEAFFRSPFDVCVIASPAPVHIENVMSCARHGKPALCEKPLAMNETEAQQMVDVMEAARLPLYVGFTYRFSPVALDIHRLVRAGAIGEVRSLRLIYIWDCHGKYNQRDDPSSGLNFRRHHRMLEGGPLVDCGVHQIDLARWWTGSEVTRVTGHGAWVETENYQAPDHQYLHMDHANGAHTFVEVSFTYSHTAREPRSEFFYELIGTQGVIRYDRQGRVFECVNAQGSERLNWTEEKNFHGMYLELERAIREGTIGNMPTAADGLAATRMARKGTLEAIGGQQGEMAGVR